MKQFGVQPSEFWRMKPRHFWWLYDMKKEARANGLTKADTRRLKKMMDVANAA